MHSFYIHEVEFKKVMHISIKSWILFTVMYVSVYVVITGVSYFSYVILL